MTEPRKALLARNSLLNLAGQLIPLLVGVASVPYVIAGMGVDGFGILSLAWMILGYFTIFDLGLGRATTKFIAAELNNGSPQRLKMLFWTSSVLNAGLGVAGGLVLVSIAALLAERVFQIPESLVGQARDSFYLLGLASPIVLVSTAFRGALEAAQRFEYVNAVNIVSSSLTFLLPVLGVAMGLDVTTIVVMLMGAKLLSGTAYLVFCFKVFPALRQGMDFDMRGVGKLLTYGGWVSVTNVIHPVLTYFERVLIGSFVTIAAVSYYTAPYEMVTRLTILPTSFAMAIFPSFSAVAVSQQGTMTGIYSRSVKLVLVLMMPLVTVLFVFAREILQLWLGSDFSGISAVVLQILVVGVLVNAMAQIPYALLQGFGRPDITAKFHVLELLMYIPLAWILVANLGIVGGAIAWTMRSILDGILMFSASTKFIRFHHSSEHGLSRGIMAVLPLIALMGLLSILDLGTPAKVASVAVILVVFGCVVWRSVLDSKERELFVSMAHSLTGLRVTS
jgi:O-antigen/teichoic acid export membrane protein